MKTAKAAKKISLPCFECEDGILESICEDYVGTLADGTRFTVRDVKMERCKHCGDTVIGAEGNRKIDEHVALITGAITPSELHAFLDKYSLTQKRASDITGLGEKNISRWLSGKMRASESISNFLRLLLADEEAFNRLQNKDWTQKEVKRFPSEDCQPSEKEQAILQQVDYAKLVKLKIVADERSPKIRRTQICRAFQCEDLIAFSALTHAATQKMAAFKDTRQRSNGVSSGLWTILGERASEKIDVEPFDQDKLYEAVDRIRELTQHPLECVIGKVKEELREAGVALVFIPCLKESALRGCTKLLSTTKAMVIHSLKYRSVSQFWIILFHELAHLLLHIKTPDDVFGEYEEQSDDPKEKEANDWAYDKLFYSDHYRMFASNHPKPSLTDLKMLSRRLKVDAGILAEIFNKKQGREVFEYKTLNATDLFKGIPEKLSDSLWSTF